MIMLTTAKTIKQHMIRSSGGSQNQMGSLKQTIVATHKQTRIAQSHTTVHLE
eukprot:m.42694 g.42694  ORF g.42694 m.42694 type:complete len:52 (-) comp19186_c0_seq1:386-541(-)